MNERKRIITNDRTVPVRLKKHELLKIMLLLDERYESTIYRNIRDKLREQLDAWETKEKEEKE